MAAIVISNTPPFGAMTNQSVAELHTVNEMLLRLQAAVATASSGFEGTPGTEFEGDGNNFGVVADPANPGAQGSAYSYALGNLTNAWVTFWTAAASSLEALDNGVTTI
jgi:hypothetical protein